jgi:hypothetical protein
MSISEDRGEVKPTHYTIASDSHCAFLENTFSCYPSSRRLSVGLEGSSALFSAVRYQANPASAGC